MRKLFVKKEANENTTTDDNIRTNHTEAEHLGEDGDEEPREHNGHSARDEIDERFRKGAGAEVERPSRGKGGEKRRKRNEDVCRCLCLRCARVQWERRPDLGNHKNFSRTVARQISLIMQRASTELEPL